MMGSTVLAEPFAREIQYGYNKAPNNVDNQKGVPKCGWPEMKDGIRIYNFFTAISFNIKCSYS